MDVKYINPFLVAVQNVFDTMIKVPFKLGKPNIRPDQIPLYEISGIIGLSGAVTGCVVVSLSKDIAFQLVSALTGEEVTELDADCTDAIGEITNMIAGNAKKDFPGGGSSISVPTVVIGKQLCKLSLTYYVAVGSFKVIVRQLYWSVKSGGTAEGSSERYDGKRTAVEDFWW